MTVARSFSLSVMNNEAEQSILSRIRSIDSLLGRISGMEVPSGYGPYDDLEAIPTVFKESPVYLRPLPGVTLRSARFDNNVVQATRVLASQAGRTMDSITRDVLAGGTNVIYAPKLAADGTETAVASRKALDKTCTLTPKLFFQAAAQLGAMNADPIGDSYIAIIHPYAAYDLKTSKEFIEVHKYADPDTMFRGEIGKLGNIRFIETSEAKIWKDSTCPDGLAVFGTLVLGAHAYGVTELEGGGLEHIVKQLGYGDDPLNQRASVGWKGMRAAERLVEQYMVRIESASSYSATAAAN